MEHLKLSGLYLLTGPELLAASSAPSSVKSSVELESGYLLSRTPEWYEFRGYTSTCSYYSPKFMDYFIKKIWHLLAIPVTKVVISFLRSLIRMVEGNETKMRGCRSCYLLVVHVRWVPGFLLLYRGARAGCNTPPGLLPYICCCLATVRSCCSYFLLKQCYVTSLNFNSNYSAWHFKNGRNHQ